MAGEMKRRKQLRGIRAHYRRVNTKTRRDWQRKRKKLRPGIQRDTGLTPVWVAEVVCDELGRFLDVDVPDRYPLWLDVMAEHIYQGNEEFRRQMRAGGNEGRDNLYGFMRHWMNAFFFHERPDLLCRLPLEYSVGNALPEVPYPSPQIRRRGYGPLPKPLNWDAARVLKHDEWNWLEKLLWEKVRRGDIDLNTLRSHTYAALVYELYGLTPEEIALVES